jgi:hypothetical protein
MGFKCAVCETYYDEANNGLPCNVCGSTLDFVEEDLTTCLILDWSEVRFLCQLSQRFCQEVLRDNPNALVKLSRIFDKIRTFRPDKPLTLGDDLRNVRGYEKLNNLPPSYFYRLDGTRLPDPLV